MPRVPRLILSRGAPDLGVPIVRLDNRPAAKQQIPFVVAYFYDASSWCWTHWHPVLKRNLGCHIQDPNDDLGDPNQCPHCGKTHREKSHFAPVAIARPSSDGPFTATKLPNLGSFSKAILGVPQTSAKDFEVPSLAGRTAFLRWHSCKRIAIEHQWDLTPKQLPAPFELMAELERHMFLATPEPDTSERSEPTLRFDAASRKGGAG